MSLLWCLFLLFVRLLTCQPHLVDSACQLWRCLSSHHQAFLDSSFLGFSLHLLWKMVMRWRPDYTPYQLWESWGTQLLCSDEPKKGCMFKAKAADMEPLTHYSKRKGRLVPTCFWMCWNFTSTLKLVLAFKSADGILSMIRKQRYKMRLDHLLFTGRKFRCVGTFLFKKQLAFQAIGWSAPPVKNQPPVLIFLSKQHETRMQMGWKEDDFKAFLHLCWKYRQRTHSSAILATLLHYRVWAIIFTRISCSPIHSRFGRTSWCVLAGSVETSFWASLQVLKNLEFTLLFRVFFLQHRSHPHQLHICKTPKIGPHLSVGFWIDVYSLLGPSISQS